MKNIRNSAVLIFLTLFISCDRTPKSLAPDAYQRWIGNKDGGLVKERKINNVSVNSRFLPNEYQAYKEWKTSESMSYDSILNSYKCGLTFQVQLQAEKTDKTYGNLIYYNIASQEDFSRRTRFLSFGIGNFITLKSNGIEYEPVLSNFEGFDQLSNKISFQIVFIVPEYNCGNPKNDFQNLILTFNDPYWDLGTINFEFEKNALIQIPSLEL